MTRELLLESLAAVANEDALYLEDGRYFDFSVEAGEGRTFEIGNADGECVQLDLSREEMLLLHAALTRTLLQEV